MGGGLRWKNNLVDPARLNGKYRDVFPKHDLFGGHLGDRHPPLLTLSTAQLLCTVVLSSGLTPAGTSLKKTNAA